MDNWEENWQGASVVLGGAGEVQKALADVDDRLPTYPLQTTTRAAVSPMATPDSGPFQRRSTPSTAPQERATLSRRAYQVYTSGKALAVPSSYVSSIASSWDPGSRSIWFQRKAVIITSIFLAIFIVLAIGAAVFLRDRREDDELLEEELDVSDEAALQRMREERRMRTANKDNDGGSSEKKRRKKRRKQDGTQDGQEEKSAAGGGARSSALNAKVASRWARIPLRRKKKSSRSSDETEPEVGLGMPRRSTETIEVHNGVEASGSSGSSHHRSGNEGETSSSSNHHDEPRSSGGAGMGDNAELSATIEEAERAAQRRGSTTATHAADGEAFPPAYIPRSGNGTSASPPPLHPLVQRPLAGSARDAMQPHDDEKLRAAIRDGVPLDARTSRTEDDDVYTQSSIAASRSSFQPLVQPNSSTAANENRDRYAAHLATDDKQLLGQIQSAASMPSASAPVYSSSSANLGPSMPGPSAEEADEDNAAGPANSIGPSAPDMLDQEGFERLDGELDQDATPLSPPRDADLAGEPVRDVKGKAAVHSQADQGTSAASSAYMLPAPPTLHQPTFSRFDMPYATEWQRPSAPRASSPLAPQASSPSSTAEAQPPSAPAASAPVPEQEESTQAREGQQSEKAREAIEEQRRATLAVVGSRPGQRDDFVEDEEQTIADHLPRYEPQRHVASGAAPSAPSLPAPSAPPAPLEEEEE